MYTLKQLATAIIIAGAITAALQAGAECVPGADPCAPQKVIGAWNSSLSFGFNLTQGNSETTLFNFEGRTSKEENRNLWDFVASYNYAADKESEDESGDDTTRNDFRASGKYGRLISERTYLSFGSTFLYDEIADVDYRVTLDPAPGYFWLKDDSFRLSTEAGPSYVFERQGRETNNYFAPRVAEKFEWALTCTSKLFQSLEAIFDVTDSENYIINAEIGAQAALAAKLALTFTIRESYDNVPAEGREKDDLQVITAIKVAL